MSGGDEHQLVGQLADIDRILVAFESPVVDEHAGLRLMDEHLRDRREDLYGKLARGETPTLEVRVQGLAAVSETLPVRFLLRLLSAVAEALDGHLPKAGAGQPAQGPGAELRWAGGVADAAGIVLQGPTRPGARAATETSGRSADFVAAVTALLDALESAAGGEPGQEGSSPEAELLDLVVQDWVRLELRWTAPGADQREVILDPEAMAASSG